MKLKYYFPIILYKYIIYLCILYLYAYVVCFSSLGYNKISLAFIPPSLTYNPVSYTHSPLPNLHTWSRIQAQCTKRKSCDKTK